MFESPDTPVTLAAIARPGDTVIIGFSRALTDEEVEWMTESFNHLIEKGIQVAFADHVSSMVVARPHEADVEEINDWGDA